MENISNYIRNGDGEITILPKAEAAISFHAKEVKIISAQLLKMPVFNSVIMGVCRFSNSFFFTTPVQLIQFRDQMATNVVESSSRNAF